ncbi:hypothetical protein DM02DRAFT_528848, partial [Periconia macrospinosa]
MADSDTAFRCNSCNKTGTEVCNICKGVSYCSKECQRADWPTHQLLCEDFAGFDVSSRPTDEHVLAILFPVSAKKPKLIWLHCVWKDDEDRRYQSPCDALKVFLGSSGSVETTGVLYNSKLERNLETTVDICCRTAFLIDGSVSNECTATITAIEGENKVDWRGPIVAYSRCGLDIDAPACKDITMADFRHITDYLRTY